ncbi:EAL domain-containing protein [Cytobacillus purgationiresistens]|uniref:Diguanylate cyclase (GGDEF)-like protein/PAS domain S-box-containing protein n=1 Tax=Cytobacillus purgationiresistens TaxID=863449 RepID=A0ABU0AC02_9BACI|nr:EAL domain-containing protein [Cytobacillus purgationiresistens]MDQ0268786.1 diguanylate cyclase (GGDEF)-like protein/PAS domain S-box-containing protein [Cytobacillus purgationiresistens]
MAQTITCRYENDNQLKGYILDKRLQDSSQLLVQVYSGILDLEKISHLLHTLQSILPNAVIAGCSTSGEIMNGQIYEQQIILCFTSFDKTEILPLMINKEELSREKAISETTIKKIVRPETKALILLTAGYEIDTQELLDKIYRVYPQMIVTGGQAGDNGTLDRSYVFLNGQLCYEGVLAIALNGEQLRVQPFTNYKIEEIGHSFTVTKARGSMIIQLDDGIPLQVLKHYLGEAYIKQLPSSSLPLPFLVNHKDESLPVFITKVFKNGSIKLNRRISAGDQLSVTYTKVENVIEDIVKLANHLADFEAETMFIFNNMSRKWIAGDFTGKALNLMQMIAPANGFFSYSEISNHQDRPKLINQSLSGIAFSESPSINIKKRMIQSDVFGQMMNDAYAHLIKASDDQKKELLSNLNMTNQYYQTLFKNNHDLVFTTDHQGYFTSVNPAFEKNTGYTEKEIVGQSVIKMISKEVVPRLRMHFINAFKGKEQVYHAELIGKSGEKGHYQIKNVPIMINGKIVGIYGIAKNLTEMKKIEDKLTELSYYDHLTGLPNRTKFIEQLNILIKRARKNQQRLAILTIDIDRFKIINDSIGHFAGDKVLKSLSERIDKYVPAGSYLGNFGGDKFTLILSDKINVEDIMKASQSILHSISEPLYFNHQEFYVTASIGVSIYPNDGLDQHSLLKNADIANNLSKQIGGNRITFFSDEMNEHLIARFEMESYLRKALQNNEFSLCYQPLIDLESGKIFGSEALLRWNHPKLGLVPPVKFIPLAEETGLINEIGKWVLNTACMQNKRWQSQGLGHLTISVNVAAQQFQEPNFLSIVQNALQQSELEAKYLTLELTESTMLENIDYSISVMKDLKNMGTKVSIDDFGTGYSSLSYLKDLPINTLKIDRSFINNLKIDTSDIAIVKAIITMGHGLHVKVLAEGVETKEQIDLLKQLKCHYAQGYYIHKPLTIVDFEKGLRESS